MAKRKRKIERREIYYIRTEGIEIGPFTSKEAALAEGRQIRSEGAEDVKVSKQSISVDADLYGRDDEDQDDDDIEIEEEDSDEDSDDDDDEWADLFADDDEDDEDQDDDDIEDEDDEDDEAPMVTHQFFRKIGGSK